MRPSSLRCRPCEPCGCCFLSSRRRHTRFDCDWSSDVCSSDLMSTIVGCGVQGELQLAAITAVLPLRHIMLVDIDPARAEELAARAADRHGLRVEPTKDRKSVV